MTFFLADGDASHWEKCLVSNFRWVSCWSRNPNCLNSYEELMDIAENSCLAYKGVPEAWRRDENGNSLYVPGNIHNSSYLYAVMRLPVIEKTLKAGLFNLTDELTRKFSLADELSNKKARKLTDVLGVSSKILGIIRDENMNLQTITEVRKIAEADQTYDADAHRELMRVASIDYYKPNMAVIVIVAEIASDYGIKISNICKYLQECYDDQCIPVDEAARIWRDWLRMGTQMKYNLKKLSDCTPRSLKKEHDRALFAWKALQEKQMVDRFKESAKENLKYEWKKGAYQVVVPMTPEEIVAEGVAQRHCVGSYVNSVREGRTCIVFIRKKTDPDHSFFTMEILNGYIVQVKGFDNIKVSEYGDEGLLKFIRDFAKAKKLRVETADVPL